MSETDEQAGVARVIERLRTLAGEPNLVVDDPVRLRVDLGAAMALLERTADWLERDAASVTKVDLSTLRWGERVRVSCGATGRYLGEYLGRRWALWVAAMDNGLMLDDTLTDEPPSPDLPVPHDRAMGAAATVLSAMSARGVRLCTDCGRQPVVGGPFKQCANCRGES